MKQKIAFLIFFTVSVSHTQIKNIQINDQSANQPNEVTIAVNPKSPNFISAGSNLRYLYTSSDFGRTWKTNNLASGWGVWGDPCVAYDANGNLFFGHLSNPPQNTGGYWIDRIVVQRSIDNGKNWDYDTGVGFSPPAKEQDKEWLCIDQTNSVFRNNIYMAWTEFDDYGSSNPADSSRIRFARSTDDGKTWQPSIRINTKSGDCLDNDNTVEGCVPAVGPNGEVYVSWAGPSGIIFDKSLDGGKIFGTDVQVAVLSAGWTFDIPGIKRCNGLPVTACDISSSKYRGWIYINWSDQINGDTEIFISKSTDGGKNWCLPKRVNNDLLKRDQFFTWMSVDPKTGIIYILFYDRRDNLDPSSMQTNVYLARSDDGGESFKNFRLSETPFFPNANIFFGDYTNIAAYDGRIYPIWMRMDGNTMSVWAAPIDDSQLIVNIEEKKYLPMQFILFQNYPNPFNPVTEISYQLPAAGIVSLKIYDLLGRELKTLVDEFQNEGDHNFKLKIENGELSSGVYYYQLKARSSSSVLGQNSTQTKKLVFLK